MLAKQGLVRNKNKGVLCYVGKPLAGQTGPCEGVGDDSIIKERSAIRLSELDAKISWFGDGLLLFFPDFVLLLTRSAATPRCKGADCAHLVDGLVVLDGVKIVAGVVNCYRLVGGHYVNMGGWRIRLGEGVGIWMDFKRDGEKDDVRVCGIDSSGECYVPRHHFYFVAQAVSSDPDIRTDRTEHTNMDWRR